MITSQLGSSTGDTAAKGAALIPVVGPASAAGIKILDALLPTTKFCDPRSAVVMAQIMASRSQAKAIRPGGMLTASERDLEIKRLRLVEKYEADCRAGLATAPYLHCMNMTNEWSKSQCEQAVTRKLKLREAAQKTSTHAALTTTPWYKNPLVLGGGAVAILGAVLLLR